MNELIEPLARTAGISKVVAEIIGIELDLLSGNGRRRQAQQPSAGELFAFGRDQIEADQLARSRQAHPA
ncbi:hypothetical protein ACQR10_10550 [Bradyrhizobium sp. HKCCYLRH2060]|uniref:hypothetical protein n=1 Tax=Bradyrhizobium TaxID=374 RepID=UPI002915CE08|nr:hypothetical protein [Bradyrhizobium sp. SZCCHNRI1009]